MHFVSHLSEAFGNSKSAALNFYVLLKQQRVSVEDHVIHVSSNDLWQNSVSKLGPST